LDNVGSPTSIRDKVNSQYISGVQTSPYKPICGVELGLKSTSNNMRGCVGSLTSTRDKVNSQYISGVQTSPYKPVLWG